MSKPYKIPPVQSIDPYYADPDPRLYELVAVLQGKGRGKARSRLELYVDPVRSRGLVREIGAVKNDKRWVELARRHYDRPDIVDWWPRYLYRKLKESYPIIGVRWELLWLSE